MVEVSLQGWRDWQEEGSDAHEVTERALGSTEAWSRSLFSMLSLVVGVEPPWCGLLIPGPMRMEQSQCLYLWWKRSLLTVRSHVRRKFTFIGMYLVLEAELGDFY